MAPDTPRSYALSVGEQQQLTTTYGTVAPGQLFTPDPEHATGDDVPHVVVSAEVAHALEVGRREMRRRDRRRGRNRHPGRPF